MEQTHKSQDGFSAVELLITLIVGALFVISFYQIYILTTQGNAVARRDAIASEIAYSNLRRYTEKPSITCDTTPTSTTNLVTNPNAAGQVLSTVTSTSSLLPGTITETVLAFAPRGCDLEFPIKVESTVTYGDPLKKVVHATYVN
jgi:Tfp pilus assembly protein PilX